jgi:hemerythrin-like domain-containing protein
MSDSRVISRNPVDLLSQEHEKFASLLAAYRDLAPEQAIEKADLFRRIDEELRHHVGTEELLFYPTLTGLDTPGLRERVGEALQQHRLLEELLTGLRRAEPGVPFDRAMSDFRIRVERHLDFEEREVFPRASRLPRVTINQLGLEIEERQMRDDDL